MIPTHEMIDPDEPRCLYCNSSCDIELKGELIARSSDQYNVEALTCLKCKETFEIHSLQDISGETIYEIFSFTCKDYCVQHLYISNQFRVGDRGLLYDSLDNQLVRSASTPTTVLPMFDVDFSNKEKLWEKLQTYLIFS